MNWVLRVEMHSYTALKRLGSMGLGFGVSGCSRSLEGSCTPEKGFASLSKAVYGVLLAGFR